MNVLINNNEKFLSLVRAGLWEQDTHLLAYGLIDYQEILREAEEQAVVGLVTAGLEHVVDTCVSRKDVLTFISTALQLEQTNKSMNEYIETLVPEFQKQGIEAVLVKGQGIAQCYNRPLWRSSGDVDIVIDKRNYIAAKSFFAKIAECSDIEKKKHQEMMHSAFSHKKWLVELHGTLHANLSSKMDALLDEVQEQMFRNEEFRKWSNGATTIMLPSPNNDVIFVFSHILQHFFENGIGLRQICDLCRLLWTYRDEIDVSLLKERLRMMGVITEWKAFASLMVRHLGYPEKDMPFYDKSFDRKGDRILVLVLESGNFGRKSDYSYTKNYSTVIRKTITVARQFRKAISKTAIFPCDSVRFFLYFTKRGIISAFNGD